MKAFALALRFALELCLLAAVAYWGTTAGGTTPVHVLLAILAPTAVAVVWGLFVSPKARVTLARPIWVVLQLGLFGLGSVALVASGHTALGVALLPAAVMNLALLMVLDGAGPRTF